MGSAEVVISDWAATGCLILIIGAAVSAVIYRKFHARLDVTALRLLGLALIAQVLVLVAAAAVPPTWSHGAWLFDIEAEWNIPSAVTSTQLALVAGAAFTIAWLRYSARSKPGVILLAIGLGFLLLSVDDHTEIYKGASGAVATILNWTFGYAAIGAAMFTASVCLALYSPRGTRSWYVCLAAGLATLGFAGFILDPIKLPCGLLGLLRIDGCLKTGVIEECLEYLGAWLALVAMLGIFSELSPTSKSRAKRVLFAIPAIWIALLIAVSPLAPFAPVEDYTNAQPTSVIFESCVRLRGFLLDQGRNTLIVHLFLSPEGWNFDDVGYSIHLIDQESAVSVASSDNFVTDQQAFSPRGAYIPVFRQWAEIDLAPDVVVNRAFWLVASLWHADRGNFLRQKVLSSDLQLLDDTQVLLAEMTFPEDPRTRAALARFDIGFALEAVDLPESVQAGATLGISFTWRSDDDGMGDFVQFLHLVHEDTGEWWGYDQQPLGPRLPMRLWYSGLADSETWRVPLPDDLAPGSYAVYTGLYRLADQERVRARDSDGAPWPDNRVALGNIVID